MYFSDLENDSRNGEAFLVPPHINKHVLAYNSVTDRILTLKLNTKLCILNLIQVYAPTEETKEEISFIYFMAPY